MNDITSVLAAPARWSLNDLQPPRKQTRKRLAAKAMDKLANENETSMAAPRQEVRAPAEKLKRCQGLIF